MSSGDARCAIESRLRDEAMAGTASRVVRWVLVEQDGPWGRDALLQSRLDEKAGRVLQSAARRHGFRPLLIRRPSWERSGDRPRRVYLARTRRDGGWLEQLDLDDVDDLLRVDWSALDSSEAPGVGRPGPPAVHLVCTNGRHDACCADRGRPVVRALGDADVPDVWESSHVGGDRFAANVVTLPVGVYYGRVEPDESVELLGDLGRGVLRLERYRGRSCFSPLAQAAEYHARMALDERRLAALPVIGAERRGRDSLAVRFDHQGRELEVLVTREPAEAVPLSCGAAPSSPWRYRLDGVADPA